MGDVGGADGSKAGSSNEPEDNVTIGSFGTLEVESGKGDRGVDDYSTVGNSRR